MKITNNGRGVHRREVKGVETLQAGLPGHWYAYTNLDLAMAPGVSRELDIIIVTDDRIVIADIKDWDGPIESRDGRWFNRGKDICASPVQKIAQNVRDILPLLQLHLKRHLPRGSYTVPKLERMIVLTGSKELGGIAASERAGVMGVEDFIRSLATRQQRETIFGRVPAWFNTHPLTSPEWKDQLSKFFNVKKGVFLPGRRSYGGFFAASDAAAFQHPGGIYSEFDASDERQSPALGVLRLWDFSKAATEFQTEEGRGEIAGREQAVVAYLQDRSDRCDEVILDGRMRDPDFGVGYWEIYDRRRRLTRLMDFAAVDLKEVCKSDRIVLARQLISALDALHLAEASHLDVGGHSVWIQRPSTVRLSHLMAASYPQVNTLGESRYQFLSSGVVPEDILGDRGTSKQRDVFLLGTTVHRILFGLPPVAQEGAPPEWDPSIDATDGYTELHSWFETAMAWDPRSRFKNAGTALTAFNTSTVQRPTAAEVLEGLERHRGEVRSQMQLYSKYPALETIRDDDSKAIWKSSREGSGLLVKMWKRASWGDQTREGGRILDFLDRLREMVNAQPPGCAKIVDAFWLNDAIVAVQEWVDSPDLATLRADATEWTEIGPRVEFCRALCDLVDGLHSRRVAHGDLKPSNILVDPLAPGTPVLIDLVDFASAADGELRTTMYAPEAGGRYERDRFAVTRIVEQLLEHVEGDARLNELVTDAIEKIRTAEPPNSTLLPLIEALEAAAVEEADEAAPILTLSWPGQRSGVLLPDEGRYFLRRAPYRRAIVIRGACEEIEVEIDPAARPFRISRRPVGQGLISSVSKHEFGELDALIELVEGPAGDLQALMPLFERADVVERLMAPTTQLPASVAGEDEEDAQDDVVEDVPGEALAEITADAPPPTGIVDVASLWNRLIDAEKDLVTYGEATEDSGFNKEARRHLVPFDLLGGSFDYNRLDRVMVERLDSRGSWRSIASLDVQRSRPDALFLDGSRFDGRNGSLVKQFDQLRFRSRFEETSLDRRHAAVSRITKRNSRTRDLIDLFDPRLAAKPKTLNEQFDAKDLEKLYGLNSVQAEALAKVLRTRPLALVQGPPGTGKTVFIAALVHAALTSGLVRNVLLSSQAHEAVNNAAEAVLKLFAKTGDVPSILRVGNENVVSDRLLPFHSERVERLFKDGFRAEMRERLAIAGRGLGLDEGLIEQLVHIEIAIRPLARHLEELEDEEDAAARENALRLTLEQQLDPLRIGRDAVRDVPAAALVALLVEACLSQLQFDRRPSPDRIARFHAVAAMSREFIASVSSEQRSFETFLAGTRQIVAGTCVGLGRSSLGLTATPFDLVIVDEAARCTASELAVPIQAGEWVVLVGDHKQLEPMHERKVVEDVAQHLGVSEIEVARSDFERVFETSYGEAAGQTLRTQYRMLPPIGDLVSSSFYARSPLQHGRTIPELDLASLPRELSHPLVWVDTSDLGERGRQSDTDTRGSLFNTAEADAIVLLLKRWSEHPEFLEHLQQPSPHAHAIGIICAYSKQRDVIRRKIQGANISPILRAALKIDTIDSYQGKQNPIVIVSLVRNNRDGGMEGDTKMIRPGFLSTPNRINVALSRAMDRLVIVGSRTRWKTGSPMASVAGGFRRKEEAGDALEISAAELLNAAPPAGSSGPSAATTGKEMAE
ncbi:hypothetical protein FSB78_10620 [Sphingomonas ginsenosidivorax]|uniref:Uncharacterized protein n=1 Tax=Sphingomonas ginsenosidivorax TaxID=862135 RepID=A0A5C6UFU6_9SPHN|nr:AAA domain-containing protein [Sphingomonas ginsenosidivorax]TXC71344.1 hypothetical protein FSB78_10620 [Sphingomonas ginsenosidivorax]